MTDTEPFQLLEKVGGFNEASEDQPSKEASNVDNTNTDNEAVKVVKVNKAKISYFFTERILDATTFFS